MEKNVKRKMELVNRPDFRFLKTYYHSLLQLKTDKEKLDFLMAIINKQFNGIEPILEGYTAFAYASIKFHVDKSLEGFCFKANCNITTQDPTTPPTISPILDPTIPPTQDPKVGPTLQEEEEEKEEKKEEEKEEKKNKPSGFEKLLKVFPPTKVYSEHECLTIWDSLTQEEKQKVIKHSSVYVRELTKKNEIQFMKNLKSYLESRIWENVSSSRKKKEVGRATTKGGIDGNFITWVQKQMGTTWDETMKEVALCSDEDYNELRNLYESEKTI